MLFLLKFLASAESAAQREGMLTTVFGRRMDDAKRAIDSLAVVIGRVVWVLVAFSAEVSI